MIFAAWQCKERLRYRYLKSLSAYFQRQDLLSSQVTTDMLFIWQRGCELNSWLKTKTCFPNEDIWRVLMAVVRHVAGLYYYVWAYKDTGCISVEGICEFHHYLRVKTFLTLKRKSKKNCVWEHRLYQLQGSRMWCLPSKGRHFCLASWMAFSLTFPSVSICWPHSRWDFKIMLKITRTKELQ